MLILISMVSLITLTFAEEISQTLPLQKTVKIRVHCKNVSGQTKYIINFSTNQEADNFKIILKEKM